MKETPNWQHIVPQREQDHEITPIRVVKSTVPKRVNIMICKECLQPVKEVPNNDGPEGLKALLTF